MFPEEEEEAVEESAPVAPRWGFWDAILAVAVGLVFGFLIVMIVAASIEAVTGSAEDLSSIIADSIATTIVYAALLASVYLLVVLRRKVAWREVGLHQPDKGFIWMTLLVWFVMVISTILIGILVSGLFGDPPDVREQLSVTRSGVSGAELFWLLTASVVAAPLVEEIVFRGLIFPSLRRRWPFWAAALASALLFAAAHQTIILIPALTVLGLALAWLKERYESLYPAIVLHGLNNGLAIVVLLALTN